MFLFYALQGLSLQNSVSEEEFRNPTLQAAFTPVFFFSGILCSCSGSARHCQFLCFLRVLLFKSAGFSVFPAFIWFRIQTTWFYQVHCCVFICISRFQNFTPFPPLTISCACKILLVRKKSTLLNLCGIWESVKLMRLTTYDFRFCFILF